MCDRVQQFPARRGKGEGRGYRRFPWAAVFGELSVHRLHSTAAATMPRAPR